MLGLVACVTALLNLDTSVVFLTPVLVHAARARSLDERPFLYGTVFMSNAASTLLPGSNLTNLLVLGGSNGSAFAARTSPAWLAACVVTGAIVVLALRPGRGSDAPAPQPRARFGIGVLATAAAAAAIVALRHPALPVAALGLAACVARRRPPRLGGRLLALLFAAAVALGAVARAWHGPATLLAGSGRWTTAGIAATGAVLVNNLPAAVLFSAQPPPHPVALLLGLDIGPNLAVTGSLSAVLWLQAARSVGARPSVVVYSLLGAVIVPITLAAALAVS
jgi:arsenical pump membrane protein